MNGKEKQTDLENILEGHASVEVPEGSFTMEQPSEPCSIIIMGASGDLTSRKLIPSLYSLFVKGGVPDRFTVVGCARTDMESSGFHAKLKDALEGSGMDLSRWDEFASHLHYVPLKYDDPASYKL